MTVALLAFGVALMLLGAWEAAAVRTWRQAWAAAATPLPWVVPPAPALPYATDVPGWVYTCAAWGSERTGLLADLLAWWDRLLDRVWNVELDLTITELAPGSAGEYAARHQPWRADETGRAGARTTARRTGWLLWPTASWPTLETAEQPTLADAYAGSMPLVSDRCWLDLNAPLDLYQPSTMDDLGSMRLRSNLVLHLGWSTSPPSKVEGERVSADHGRWCVVFQRAVSSPPVRDATSVPAGAA